MQNKKLGIIGGSGLYDIKGTTKSKWETISTPWGKPSDEILSFEYANHEVYFYT